MEKNLQYERNLIDSGFSLHVCGTSSQDIAGLWYGTLKVGSFGPGLYSISKYPPQDILSPWTVFWISPPNEF
jgi:hypothetical protein